MNNFKCLVGLAMASLCGAQYAGATVSYQVNSGGLESFNVKIDGSSYFSALAGGIAITRVGGDTGVPANYVTVCTDIEGTLYLGSTYTYDKPVSFSGLTGIDPTWGADNGPSAGSIDQVSANKAIQNAAALFYGHYSVLTSGTTDEKAALQLAVWAAIYNTDKYGNVSGTRFALSGTGTAITDANNWLSGLNGSTAYTGGLFYPDPLNQGNADNQPPQELLIRTQDFAPVPETTTLLAGALLLLPFGASTLRILRKNRAA